MQEVGSRVDAGSFRDRDSRVFLTDGGVYRALSARGLADYEALAKAKVFAKAQSDGKLVGTRVSDLPAPTDILPGETVAAVLEHDRIPFVSYPYEWSFGMLKDAALVQLDLLLASLGENLTLKDSTPYNVQFRGAKPVFVDVGSFETLRAGEAWIGYRQFCMLYLFPLMFQAYRDVPFQPWLKGSLDGISPIEAAGVLSGAARFRKGVPLNVRLAARMERKQARTTSQEVKRDLQKAGMKKEILVASVKKMRKIVERLEWKTSRTAWTHYDDNNRGYAEAELQQKKDFVSAAAQRVKPRLAWDLGANDGAFARIIAEHATDVVAMDFDHATVEHMYRDLAAEGNTQILPLVVDLTDPSPARGWGLAERGTLAGRGAPDFTLSLALVHHISITRNVPIVEVVRWLASLGGTHVVEFPTRDDAMVKILLGGKRDDDSHPDYDLEHFEACLAERFEIRNRLALGSRVLFEATARDAA